MPVYINNFTEHRVSISSMSLVFVFIGKSTLEEHQYDKAEKTVDSGTVQPCILLISFVNSSAQRLVKSFAFFCETRYIYHTRYKLVRMMQPHMEGYTK